jgi:hypothetical protein
MNGITATSFRRGLFTSFRGLGNALLIASRTMHRCTPNFLATPYAFGIGGRNSFGMFLLTGR